MFKYGTLFAFQHKAKVFKVVWWAKQKLLENEKERFYKFTLAMQEQHAKETVD